MMRSTLLSAMCFCALMIIGCSEDATDPTPTAVFTLSGTISNPKNITIPPTAKLVAVWGVSATSPDYAYVFGNTSIDRTANTFKVELPTLPPDSALNAWGTDPASDGYRRLGVCYVVLIDDPGNELQAGRVGDDGPVGGLTYGAIDNTAIIYRKGKDAAFSDTFPWVSLFPDGLSVGQGVEIPNAMDGFTPLPATGLQLKVDTVRTAFTFPNWS